MIPRTLHRVWLDDPILDTFESWWQQWRHLHPDWEIRDWRSTEELPALANQALFDQAPDLMPDDWKRFRSDVVRLELLYRFGGVYVDADTQPLRTIDRLIEGRECVVGYSPQTNPAGEHPITNAVIAAAQFHPYIGACLEGLAAAVEDFAGRTLAQVIGPWHLTRTLHHSLSSGIDIGTVTVLSHDELYEGPWLRHLWANRTLNRKGGLT